MRLLFFSILAACTAGAVVSQDRDAANVVVASPIGTRNDIPINRTATAASEYPVCLYRNNDQSGWVQCINPMANIIVNVPRPCYGFPIDPEISSLGFFRKVYGDTAWQAVFYDGAVCDGNAIYFASSIIKVDRLDVYGWDNRIKSVNFFWNTETPDATLIDPTSFHQDDTVSEKAIVSPLSERTETLGQEVPIGGRALCLFEGYELQGTSWCPYWPDPKYNDQSQPWCGGTGDGVNISSLEIYRTGQDAKPFQIAIFDALGCQGNGRWLPFYVYNVYDLRTYGWDKRIKSVAFWWGNKPPKYT